MHIIDTNEYYHATYAKTLAITQGSFLALSAFFMSAGAAPNKLRDSSLLRPLSLYLYSSASICGSKKCRTRAKACALSAEYVRPCA
jgi:hypothetical protein